MILIHSRSHILYGKPFGRILYEVWAAYIWSVLLLMTSVSHPFPKAEVTVERKTDR